MLPVAVDPVNLINGNALWLRRNPRLRRAALKGSQNRRIFVARLSQLLGKLATTDRLLDFNHYGRSLGSDVEAMVLEFLPKEVRDGLDAARLRDQNRKSRLRVQVGEAVFPVLRFWHDGLALDGKLTPHLRGRVDIYDGARHVYQCLIVASSLENGELICDFKRSTPVSDTAPLDFWRDPGLPVALLPRG